MKPDYLPRTVCGSLRISSTDGGAALNPSRYDFNGEFSMLNHLTRGRNPSGV